MEVPEEYKRVETGSYTGTVWMRPIVKPDETINCKVQDVLYEAGSRSHWHVHPANQVLIVIEGAGYYRAMGQPLRTLRPDDVIQVLPGIHHWHGATLESFLILMEINLESQLGLCSDLSPVDDQEYTKYKNN